MNVSDLLKNCPMDDILAALAARDSAFDDRGLARDSYQSLIEDLRGRAIAPDGQHIILGHRYLYDGRYVTDVSLFSKKDIRDDFAPMPEMDGIEDIAALFDDDVERLLYMKSVPTSWAIDFISWDELMGYDLDDGNVQDVGSAELLAALLYEMTFWGMEEADMEVERDELERRGKELDKIMELPPDARKEHLKSADDVMADLGVMDTRSDEEWDADIKAMHREDLYNKLQVYRAVKKYKEGA